MVFASSAISWLQRDSRAAEASSTPCPGGRKFYALNMRIVPPISRDVYHDEC
jgi:hypothetical protein